MRILRVAAPLLAIGLAVAACSGTAATPAPATPAPTTAAVATPAPASAAPAASTAAGGGGYDAGGGGAAGSAAVSLATTGLGKVLVGDGGKTLYVFLADSGGKSACNGGCAAKWPVLTGSPTLGAGLDASDFGTITRDDGTKQVTFYNQPLYYFAGDSAAGQTNGQGIGSSWYVVDGDGKPIK